MATLYRPQEHVLSEKTSDPHPELESEQQYLLAAYSLLDEARERASQVSANAEVGRGGTTQARYEREVMTAGVLNRLQQLNVGDRSLVFGRIDQEETGDRFYIGRMAVWNSEQDPIVVDWRAPIAEAFYRATATETFGIERRRHFATRGMVLLGLEDELFGELARKLGAGEQVRGQGALVAALEESRTGRLGDIVATIQGEQDEIIRAPMQGILVVQGGPGTGKTVVALHRAAYLLYTDRFPLEGQGVLVIGPNRLFLAYIEQVLPSLGEVGVELAVVSDLLRPRVRVDGLDSELVGDIKGDLRMIEVLGQAVRDRERPLREDLVIGYGVQRLRLTRDESRRIVRDARRRARNHNMGRRIVEDAVFAALAASARRPVEARAVRERLLGTLGLRMVLEWMWPVLTPAHLLHDLYGSRALLRSANLGEFSDEEIQRLYRPRSAHADEVTWTFQDGPLLDEARAFLGYRPGHKNEDAVRTYGHICIDEAQDLSPLALRMVSRRSLNASMTIVGDIAQATGSWAHENWESVLQHLEQRHPPKRVDLTIGYRIPGPAMELANRVLPFAAPGLAPPIAVRTEGDPSRIVAAREVIEVSASEVVTAELAQVGLGNVAVVVPDSLEQSIKAGLVAAQIDFGGATRRGLQKQVTVVPVRLVKGLEVDTVVVVEPARIVAEERQGVRSLYVALTRATRRVVVVHSEPLPEMLT